MDVCDSLADGAIDLCRTGGESVDRLGSLGGEKVGLAAWQPG